MVMTNDPQYKWRELASWRELLKPWLSAMRRADLRLELRPLHSVSDREDLWFKMYLPSDKETWHDVVKGMEMLDLVARIDRDCAWRLLFENACSHATRLLPLYGEMLWNTTSGPHYPQYELKICTVNSRNEIDLSNLLHLIQNDEKEAAREKSVHRMLLGRVNCKLPGGRALDRSVDGYVQIRLNAKISRMDTSGTTYVLRKMAQLARGLDNPSMGKMMGVYPLRNAHRGVFQCHSYRIKFHSSPLNDEIIEALRDLQTVRAVLTHVVAPPMWFSQLPSDAVNCFLAAKTRLRIGKLDEEGVRKVFSAIAQCETIPALAFMPGFTGLRRNGNIVVEDSNLGRPEVYWPWLAYALFSEKATHNATAVTICIEGLTFEHVAMMEEVLTHDDPLELLNQTETTAIITSGWEPPCWPMPEELPLPTHTIRHLSISLAGAFDISLVVLLRLVGGPIIRLSLSEIGPSFVRHFLLDSVFLYCPNLRRLDLDKLFVETLDWFKYRYRLCHNLETLCIENVALDADEVSGWTGLFTTLSDPTHALAMTLRELHVNLTQLVLAFPPTAQNSTYSALARMLDENKRLERVEIAQCPHWMMAAYKDRVTTALEITPASARRIRGFFPPSQNQPVWN